jgi:hypothetical protein
LVSKAEETNAAASPIKEDFSKRAVDFQSAAPCFAEVPQQINNPEINACIHSQRINNLFGNKIEPRMVLLIDGMDEK